MKKILTVIAALGLEQGQALPEWYTVFEAGEITVEGFGSFLVDDTAWQLVAGELARRGNEIVFDYEHQTLKDIQAPAAGWCKEWRFTPDVGIEARVAWTDTAAGYLAAGEYRYFSPVFQVRESDRRLIGIHSVALTNAPRTNNLQPLLAKLGAAQTEEDNDMLKMILAALGLSETATEDEAKTAIAKLRETKEVLVVDAKIPAALGIEKDADVSVVVASINALKQEKNTMVSREEFAALQAKLTEREVTEVVAKAMAAGKITPDQKEWATQYATNDLKGFATFVAKAPVVIPVDGLGKQTKKPDGEDQAFNTVEIAAKAGEYKEQRARAGTVISYTEAVAHILQGGK